MSKTDADTLLTNYIELAVGDYTRSDLVWEELIGIERTIIRVFGRNIQNALFDQIQEIRQGRGQS